jgi:hypothetical protein
MNNAFQSRLRQTQIAALVIGLIALAASAIGAFSNTKQFFFSYLFACLVWLGLSLGCLTVTMIHNLTGGRWGYPTRRFLEAGYLGLPLMLLLFVPLFFGLHAIYPWAQSGEVLADKVLQHRHAYQNVAGFVIRALIVLGVWAVMAIRLRGWSLDQDVSADAGPTLKARFHSGIGLVILTLLATVVYVDWIMSLEKHWRSTMFAVIVLIGQILFAYAFSIVLLTLFRRETTIAAVVNKTHYHHLGNLLLTFVLFWTYVSFGQLLIIYSGDLPHEIDWYLHRIAGDWKWLIVALGVFHFFIPFFLLLFRAVKLHTLGLTILAGMVFLLHIADIYWLVMPALHRGGMQISWLDFTALFGVGGIWLSLFVSRLRAAPLLPQRDPGMQFAFTYGH